MTRWATVVVVVSIAAAAAVLADEDVVDVEVEAPEQQQLITGAATGRTISEWTQSFMEWMGYDYDDDYDDYYDYDYQLYYPGSGSAQVGYGLPSVGYSPTAGAHSSYSSYQPYQVVRHPQHINYNARGDDYEESESAWSLTDMVAGFATIAVPLAVLSMALPPTFVPLVVRRSFDDGSSAQVSMDSSELPLLHDILEARDFTPLLDPHCQRKLFCELTKIGEDENSSFMQRALYYMATLTPDPIARRVGLARLFRVSRAGQCEALACREPAYLSSLSPPDALPPSNHLTKASPQSQDLDVEE